MSHIKREVTRIIEEDICDNCGRTLEHFHKKLGKCVKCGKEICPSCTGIYTMEISRFKGCGGVSHQLKSQLCLKCGDEFCSAIEENFKQSFKAVPANPLTNMRCINA